MVEILKIFFIKMLTVSLISGLLIAAIQIVSPGLKKRYSARWRYWAWLLLAIWMLVPVMFSFNQAPIQVQMSDPVIIRPVTEAPPVITEPKPNETPQDPDTQTPDTETPIIESPTAEASGWETLVAAVSALLAGVTIFDILITVWLAGVVISLLGRWISALKFRSRLRRKWRPCDSPEVIRCVRQTMETMGFHQELDLKFCKDTQSPFVTGLFRPVLVLPEQEFDDYLLKHIIRHELTHCKRRDLWYKLIINLATIIHWFNPLVWVMNRTSDRDLELICDEIVTRGHNISSRKDYGESILLTVKPITEKRPAALTTSFSVGAKNLKERFESIMLTKIKRSGVAFLAMIAIVAILASVGVSCGISANKFDWDLYINTEWHSEEVDADLYFKQKDKGLVFDLYVNQICVLEDAQTAGKLKSTGDGFIDSFEFDYEGMSVKASATFDQEGNYVIVTVEGIAGLAFDSVRFEKVGGGADLNGPPSLSEVESKAGFYLSWLEIPWGRSLVNLGLMTEAQLQTFWSKGGSGKYVDTGVLLADYERACLRYISKSYFDRAYAQKGTLKISDGKVFEENIRTSFDMAVFESATYLETTGNQYWYAVVAVVSGATEGPPTRDRYEIAFVLENGNYVIDEIKYIGSSEPADPNISPPLSLSSVQDKAEYYFVWFEWPHSGLLPELNLMTTAQYEALKYQLDYRLTDGEYLDTGVEFTAFRNACLKYLSNRFLNEKNSLSGDMEFPMCDARVVDGKLVLLRDGHGGYHYDNCRNITYVGAIGNQYWYSFEADLYKGRTIYTNRYKIAFIFENGNYVLDEFCFVKTLSERENPNGEES